MVVKIEEYRCEICGWKYGSFEEAQKCEARGKPDLSAIPVGLMVGNPSSGSSHLIEDMTFAVAQVEPFQGNRHLFKVSMWACRDTGVGDSLGDELCSDGALYDKHNWASRLQHSEPTPEDLAHPTWKRLEDWLICQPITPTCLVDREVVSVEEARSIVHTGEPR